MNAQTSLPVDSLVSNWPVLLVAVIVTVAAFLLPGCADKAAAKLTVQVATLKVIDGDVDRAERIVDIVSAARLALTNESATTVEALKKIVKAKIDWKRLDAGDTLLANLLIETVAEKLQERFEPDMGEVEPTPWKLKADAVLKWVESAAETQRSLNGE